MEYRFLDRSDDELLAGAALPTGAGIALALRTTGFEPGRDEVVELAICDLSGNTLFNKRVKPQNVEGWAAGAASGGLSPADVTDAPELYQFEDEIAGIVGDANTIVACHLRFAREAIETSWASLPDFEGHDLVELFCQSHCTRDYPGKPAAAAALPDIAAYYGLDAGDGTCTGEAALVAACYRVLVAEHEKERDAKGSAHWERYDEARADERAQEERRQELVRKREHRMNQMNGLLWFAGAIIFTSLAIQLSQRGADTGVIIISGAIAVFAVVRGIANFRK